MIDLNPIKERLDGIEILQWSMSPSGDDYWHISEYRPHLKRDDPFARVFGEAYAAFLAHAAEDIDALITEVERLRSERQVLMAEAKFSDAWVQKRLEREQSSVEA